MNNNRLKISEPNLLFLYSNRPVILCDSVMQIMRVCILATLPFCRRRNARAIAAGASLTVRSTPASPMSLSSQCRNPNGGWIDWSVDSSRQFLVAVISSPQFYSVRFRSFVEGFFSVALVVEIPFYKSHYSKLFGDYDDFIIISSCNSHARQHF